MRALILVLLLAGCSTLPGGRAPGRVVTGADAQAPQGYTEHLVCTQIDATTVRCSPESVRVR